MSKMLKYIAKYSILIVFGIFLIVMIALTAVGVIVGKESLFFIPDNLSEYCYDVQTVGEGNISDYKNVSKISEFTSQTPILAVNINYSTHYHAEHTTIYNGYDGKRFAIGWSSSDDAYKAELYISVNIDGKRGDSFRKNLCNVDYEIEGSTLTINIQPNNLNLNTYDITQLIKDTTEYDFNNKLQLQFYTKITN